MKRKPIVFFFFVIFVLIILVGFHRKFEGKVRIYCMILTTPKFFETRTRAIYETWGSRCDQLIFISEFSNKSTNLPIISMENSQEGYEYLPAKSIFGFEYIYQNQFQQFDWFLKTDDDTYIIMEHLRQFLRDKDPSSPITYGYNYRLGYQSGGSGYVLSKESLRRFHQGIAEKSSFCQLNEFRRNEDMFMGDCLSSQGVYQGKSIDDFNRQRFHPLTYIDHFHGNFPQWFRDFSEDRHLKKGSDCCSDSSIAFHYVNPDLMYIIDAFLYKFRIENHLK